MRASFGLNALLKTISKSQSQASDNACRGQLSCPPSRSYLCSHWVISEVLLCCSRGKGSWVEEGLTVHAVQRHFPTR